MSRGTRLIIYIKASEVNSVLIKAGYTVMTFRKILTQFFSWKSSSEIKEHYKITDSLLNAKLAWKGDQEKTKVMRIVSQVLQYLDENHAVWVDRTSGIFWQIDGGYKVLAQNRAKYEINKTVKETYNIEAYL